MSRELENQIKRANNMLEYYYEKLIKDEQKLKSAKFSKIFSLIEIIILFIINTMFFILVTYALATGNILPGLLTSTLYAGTLDKLVKNSKEYKKIKENYLSLKQNVIQDSSYIKTYEEELNKALSKLNELENELKKDNTYTLKIINRDFEEQNLNLIRNDKLEFEIINEDNTKLDYNLSVFMSYVIKKKEVIFTPAEMIAELNLLITPSRFGRLLNRNIKRLEKEGIYVELNRTATSRNYKAKFIDPLTLDE